MNNNLLDIKQLSIQLNCSVQFIRKLVRRKELPFIRLGTKLLFSPREIDNWLMKNQHENQYK